MRPQKGYDDSLTGGDGGRRREDATHPEVALLRVEDETLTLLHVEPLRAREARIADDRAHRACDAPGARGRMWTGDAFLGVPAGGTFIRGRSTGPRARRAPPRARASRAHRRARRANARGRDDRASVAGSRSARAHAEGGRESARSRRGKKGFERATRRRRIEARDLTRAGRSDARRQRGSIGRGAGPATGGNAGRATR